MFKRVIILLAVVAGLAVADSSVANAWGYYRPIAPVRRVIAPPYPVARRVVVPGPVIYRRPVVYGYGAPVVYGPGVYVGVGF